MTVPLWLVAAALYAGVLIGLAIARFDWLGTIDHKEE